MLARRKFTESSNLRTILLKVIRNVSVCQTRKALKTCLRTILQSKLALNENGLIVTNAKF